ncbi:MAG: ribbon-helix-helix protein, CopG family [Oscillospiraceae bacterium]|nr:ribbon-helix-helix protein, CopG family [Oscillospiraceae bacterium]
MDNKLHIIKRPNVRKDEKYRTVTVRLKTETIEQLDRIAKETYRSRTGLINLMIRYGLENCEIIDE